MAEQKFSVEGDQYRSVDRRMEEIKRQLSLRGGSPLDPVVVERRLQQIIQPDFDPEPYSVEDLGECLPYSPGFRHRSVDEQMVVWRKLFPKLDSSYVPKLFRQCVPRGAEFWFVCPKPSCLIGGLDWLLAQIAKTRKLTKWRAGAFGPDGLRCVTKTYEAHQWLNGQPGDYWVFPVQLGVRHGGCSMRKAMQRLTPREFGLGSYEVVFAMLTHPDRITGPNQLWFDALGVRYVSGTHDLNAVLGFYWNAGHLFFDNHRPDGTTVLCGAATGFLP